MSSRGVIDIDLPTTWPPKVVDLMDRLALTAPEPACAFQDLSHHIDFTGWDHQLRSALAGRWLRVLHATRLLPHEADDIHTRGQMVLTPELISYRQDRARELGHLSAAEHQVLRDSSLFAVPHPPGLDLSQRICFTTTRYPLRTGKVNDQLRNWGGEAQYNTSAWKQHGSPAAKTLGRPAVVVALIDGSDPQLAHVSQPDLVVTFLGTRLGLHDAGVTIHHRGPVPGPQIEAIWHPGHPAYEALALPSA